MIGEHVILFSLFQDPDKMEFEEFIEFMKKVEKMSGKPEDQESKLVTAFRYFDTDGR